MRIQAEIDARKGVDARRLLGQFATPPATAREIVDYGISLLDGGIPIRFLEPSLGTGAFFSALRACVTPERIISATGFEIDADYAAAARHLWDGLLDVRQEDFLAAQPVSGSVSLLVANPPYVRHQLIPAQRKRRLREILSQRGLKLSGLAGLHCHFLLLAHAWLAPGAVSAWLIPNEFMDVNYGSALREHLLRDVRLIRIHRFPPDRGVFDDALVSSAVTWSVNTQDDGDYDIEVTCGSSIAHPESTELVRKSRLDGTNKWTHAVSGSGAGRKREGDRLGDFFVIRRGVVTGDNNVFIVTREDAERFGLERRFLRPIVPSPRHVPGDEIGVDADGLPLLGPQRFLLDCDLDEEIVRERHPRLWAWLEPHRTRLLERHVCRTRHPWYRQERRPPAPILCSYMGRGNGNGRGPFRFVLNESGAVATNSWLLLHPRRAMTPEALRRTWRLLGSLPQRLLEREGRIYGGGLRKLEPGELAAATIPGLRDIVIAGTGTPPGNIPRGGTLLPGISIHLARNAIQETAGR